MFQRLLLAVFAFAILLDAPDAYARGPLLAVDSVETRVMSLAPRRTLSELLEKAGIRRVEAALFSNALARRLDLRNIHAGQTFILYQTGAMKRNGLLRAVAVPVGRKRTVLAYRETGVKRIRFGTYPDAEAAEIVQSAAIGPPGPTRTGKETHRLRNGDSLIRLLVRAGVERQEANRAARALRAEVDLRRLRPAEPVEVEFARRGDAVVLVSVRLPKRGADAEVRRDAFGIFRQAAAEAPAAPEPFPEPPPPPAPEARTADSADETSNDADELVFATLERGETLSSALRNLGMTPTDTLRAVLAAGGAVDPGFARTDRRIAYAPADGRIRLFAVEDNRGDALLIERTGPDTFVSSRVLWADLDAGTPRGADVDTALPEAPPAPVRPDYEAPARPERIELARIRIQRGDTLINRLVRSGATRAAARSAVGAYADVADPDRIRAGQDLVLPRGADGSPVPGFFLETGNDRGVLVVRNADGGYVAVRESRGAAEARLAGSVPAADDGREEVAAAETGPEAGIEAGLLTVAARRNDTLGNMLLKVGADPRDIDKALRAIREVFDPRRLKVNQIVDIKLGETGIANAAPLEHVAVRLSPVQSIAAVRNGGGYKVKRIERAYETVLVRRSGTINSSLYQAATDGGLPMTVFASLVRMYSYDIDFQREIQPGDGFEVMFEARIHDGEAFDHGRILYAAMLLDGERRPLYRYEPRDGGPGYFDAEGRTAVKPLMRTPIDGARISSRFGMRRHPISGYNKMHRGTDFAAPTGTPVYAAGDGVVERIGRYGAYGKYVRIRHNSDYKTAYAHLSRFASGLARGSRVTQGEVIARVGSTGRSTGPHLHYEVIFRDKRVNPLAIDLPTAQPLAGGELERFLAERDRLDGEWEKDPQGPGQHVRARLP